VRRGLLWLAFVDLRRAWVRSSLAALAIALALIAVTFFAGQITIRQTELLTGYEEAGASTFVVGLSKVDASDTANLVQALRSAADVQSVEAPYSGAELGLVADTSFVVFENEKQQESLGARTTALGVATGVVSAGAAVSILPIARTASTFIFAAGVTLVAASLAALPVLLWPLTQAPAQLLRVSA